MVSIVLGGDITEELGSELVMLFVIFCNRFSIGDAMIGPVKSKEDYVSRAKQLFASMEGRYQESKSAVKKALHVDRLPINP